MSLISYRWIATHRPAQLPQSPGVRLLPILDFPDYVVGDNGEVWSAKTSRWVLKRPTKSPQGYWITGLRLEGRLVTRKTCRLVLEAFVGRCPRGMVCRHLDGNKDNNHLTNLAWGTPAENAADRVRHGNSCPGSKNFRAKLDEKAVAEIKKRLNEGESRFSLMRAFGVCYTSLYHIAIGKTWRHVPSPSGTYPLGVDFRKDPTRKKPTLSPTERAARRQRAAYMRTFLPWHAHGEQQRIRDATATQQPPALPPSPVGE